MILFCIFAICFFFFFNDTATTEIYTLSLHDALPIKSLRPVGARGPALAGSRWCPRSEEHTSELQAHVNLVCRLLLEKKKNNAEFNYTVHDLTGVDIRPAQEFPV